MKQPSIEQIRKALPLSAPKERKKPGRKKKEVVEKPERVYKLISQTNAGKQVSAYVILHPSGKHVGTVHIYYGLNNTMRVDVFSGPTLADQYQGPIVHHFEGNAEKYPFSTALSGIILADVRLYEVETKLGKDKPVSSFEKGFYLPGLDRLKAAGYNVIKAI